MFKHSDPTIEIHIDKTELLRLIYCEFHVRTLWPSKLRAKDIRDSIDVLTCYVGLLERFEKMEQKNDK